MKKTLLVLGVMVLFFTGCHKDNEYEEGYSYGYMAVMTKDVKYISGTRAECGGNVEIRKYGYGMDLESKGVCWSTSPNPTIDDNKTENGDKEGEFTSTLTDLTYNTTYYVRAYATHKKGTSYGEEKSFKTLDYYNGHDYVDLGLPSGLKWATCNVGAYSPEDYGDYFAWGETTTKSTYTESNSATYGLSISQLQSQGYIDGDGNLTPSHDAAYANWGGSWRLPTEDELVELRNKCTWTWTTENGVKGYKVTGPNGNIIFLPAAGRRYESSLSLAGGHGYYWSSPPNESNSYNNRAYGLHFYGGYQEVYWYNRDRGQSVRPVSE